MRLFVYKTENCSCLLIRIILKMHPSAVNNMHNAKAQNPKPKAITRE
ncbi:MAG: hypothetical protein TRG1_3061 [Flavobacteriaceae bacterium FS1-H7996/R]|nr:MAG: hypothetical protein TRG1_3061 [Flavobacteriaceae bacterium FS1-H7996/R]